MCQYCQTLQEKYRQEALSKVNPFKDQYGNLRLEAPKEDDSTFLRL